MILKKVINQVPVIIKNSEDAPDGINIDTKET